MDNGGNKMGRVSIALDPDPAAAYYRKKMEQEYGSDSGMVVVGKLLPLNANAAPFNNVNQMSGGSLCNPVVEDNDVLDESELTYGETACSFGFPYNDHNYACPLGLSPPSSPPHLRDVKFIPHTEDWWLEQEQKRALKQQQQQANKSKKQSALEKCKQKSPVALMVTTKTSNDVEVVPPVSVAVKESEPPTNEPESTTVTSNVAPTVSNNNTPTTVTVKSVDGCTKYFLMTRNNSATSLNANMAPGNPSADENTSVGIGSNAGVRYRPAGAAPSGEYIPPSATVTSRPIASAPYSRISTASEPDLCRVYNLPDHLCISPSALSDLESEDDRDDVDTGSMYMVASQQQYMYDPSAELEELMDDTASQSVYSHPDSAGPNAAANEGENNDNKQQRYANSALFMALTRPKRAGQQAAAAATLPWKNHQHCDEILKNGTMTVRCVCGTTHIDDAMIQCLGCGTWQHFDCMLGPKDEQVHQMETYQCASCSNSTTVCPRRAKLIQTAKLKGECIPALWLHEFRVLSENEVLMALCQHKSQSRPVATTVSSLFGKGNEGEGSNASSIMSPNSQVKQEDVVPDETLPTSSAPNKEESSDVTTSAQIAPQNPLQPLGALSRASRRKQDLTGQRVYVAPARMEDPSSGSKTRPQQSLISNASLPSNTMMYGSQAQPTVDNASTHGGAMIPASYNTTTYNNFIYPVKRGRNVSYTGRDGMPTLIHMLATRDDNAKFIRMIPKTADETYIRGSSMETLTNPLGTAWMKDYTPIDCNLYSDDILNYVRENREYNPALIHTVMPSFLLRKPTCRIVIFDHNYKGLEASARILPGESIIEYRGKVMLKEEYEMLKDPIADFNRCVLFYRRLSDVTIAIDAAECGNEARYIRRSCRPNCEPRHLFVGDELHFHIVSMAELIPGVELTIPFDYDYTTCRHHVECACGTSRCPVHRWIRSVQTRRAIPKLDYSKYIKNQLRALSQPLMDIDTSSNAVHQAITSTYNSAAHNYLHPPVTPRNTSLTQSSRVCGSGVRSATSEALDEDEMGDMDEEEQQYEGGEGMEIAPSTSAGGVISLSGRPVFASSEVDAPGVHERKRGHETKKTAQDHGKPPFEPIITTRRQMRESARSSSPNGSRNDTASSNTTSRRRRK